MTRSSSLRRRPLVSVAALGASCALALTACTAPAPPASTTAFVDWSAVESAAEGQSVDLWMWGGDEQGNSYVDTVLAPAAADQGVTLRRVPIADTADALNRVLTELQAGRTDDGSVDLVWVNGDNFLTGSQAAAWLCEWTPLLPNMERVSASDPLLTQDFGAPVNGCEAPWNKAQFTFAYNSDVVDDPPSSMAELLEWIDANPGRFTYPAPPDFTGSAFLRQVLYSTSGGYGEVASEYSPEAFDALSPALYAALDEVAPSLWRGGNTYPADSEQLNSLYADGEVDFTMTYGPATLTKLVADGTYPSGTKVLTLDEGTLGNASFLAIPVNAADAAGAMVVANLALAVDQQVAKADPATWGQFTVLDYDSLNDDERLAFDDLPSSPVVPPFDELSAGANPELEAGWVRAIDEGWRTQIAARQ
ncbi:ABC transporter substrate-binding protein (plasmid) [Coraliomargarita sp. W4R53]